MKGLTKKQKEVMDFIQSYIKTNGYSPSYRDIQNHFKFQSLGSVYNYIKVLKRKQALEGERRSSRSLTPVDLSEPPTSSDIELPFIGYLSSGAPIDTFPQIQTASVSHNLVPNPAQTYVLRARGDTLNDELIGDGDLLLIEARREARPGETVLVLFKQEQTFVKKYYPEGQYVRLESVKHDPDPLIISNEEITIHGIIVGLIRFYE